MSNQSYIDLALEDATKDFYLSLDNESQQMFEDSVEYIMTVEDNDILNNMLDSMSPQIYESLNIYSKYLNVDLLSEYTASSDPISTKQMVATALEAKRNRGLTISNNQKKNNIENSSNNANPGVSKLSPTTSVLPKASMSTVHKSADQTTDSQPAPVRPNSSWGTPQSHVTQATSSTKPVLKGSNPGRFSRLGNIMKRGIAHAKTIVSNPMLAARAGLAKMGLGKMTGRTNIKNYNQMVNTRHSGGDAGSVRTNQLARTDHAKTRLEGIYKSRLPK